MEREKISLEIYSIGEGKISIKVKLLDYSLIGKKSIIILREFAAEGILKSLLNIRYYKKDIEKYEFILNYENEFIFFVGDKFSYNGELLTLKYNIIIKTWGVLIPKIIKSHEIGDKYIEHFDNTNKFKPKNTKINASLIKNFLSLNLKSKLIFISYSIIMPFILIIMLFFIYYDDLIYLIEGKEFDYINIFFLLFGTIMILYIQTRGLFVSEKYGDSIIQEMFTEYINTNTTIDLKDISFEKKYTLEDMLLSLSNIDLYNIKICLVSYEKETSIIQGKKSKTVRTIRLNEKHFLIQELSFISKEENIFKNSKNSFSINHIIKHLIPIKYQISKTNLNKKLERIVELRIKSDGLIDYIFNLPIDFENQK